MNRIHRLDTAAASDVHIGSKRAHVRRLHREWESLYDHAPPRQFIIVGDFFDDIDDVTDDDGSFSERRYLRLPHKHREFIEWLAQVHHDGVSRVVVTEGNHDRNRRKRLIGLKTPHMPFPLVEEVVWELAGEHWLATHGHTIDPEWLHKRWIPETANKLFRTIIHPLDTADGRFSRWVEQRVTTHRRHVLAKLLQPALAALGLARGMDHVIGGHSHFASRHDRFKFGHQTIVAHNCGCWVKDECSWLSVNAAGGVRLHVSEA